ncbi:MAG: methionine--tRNA ligase [Pyrodictiaceae archaeon]
MGRWIVASAWPYVNTVPHLGNLIGSVLSADVFARYLRLKGEDVIFISGSDEHGTPIEIEAIKKGVEPKKLTDEAHNYVKKLFDLFEISFDNYSRTENDIHKKFVKELLMKIYENGYIFRQKETLPYCPRDKMFLPDRFIVGKCPYCGFPLAHGDQCDNCGRLLHPTELINPKCAICGGPVEFRETIHWFFDLPKLASRIKEWLESSNLPDNVKNYSLNWIKEGLRPRSITRDNKWGIEAPFPGAEDKTIYVWFDALLGYISATIEYGVKRGEPELWKRYWLDKDTKTVYFIGKDNIPFHAIILPAILIASHEPYTLPYYISATEYLMYEGQQFSKSRRIGIWIDEALEILPADYWRFALIRMRPETRDTNFTWKEFYRIVNTEMNDDIGNFVNRVLKFIESRFNGIVPEPDRYTEEDKNYIELIRSSPRRVGELMESLRLKQALEEVIELARAGNQYLNRREPWAKIRTNPREAATIIFIAVNAVAALAILLWPFIPLSAEKLWHMLGVEEPITRIGWDNAGSFILRPGHRIGKVEPLFRKLPQDFIKDIDKIIAKARENANRKRPPILRFGD